MGFGTIAANAIMFIGIIIIAGSFVIVMNNYIQQTTTSLQVQKNTLNDQIKTDITITSAVYNQTTHILECYVENTGKTTLIVNDTDIYIDGYRISRDNRTISVQQDTQASSTYLWYPNGIIQATATYAIGSGIHQLNVVTDHGVSDQYTFSVG